ncbi:hypothetical protein E2493_15805 [Sphingomonas parva]|uniref:Uncharacterized protein n=1 Tax=Sphingomonas parva TaxID=2555898 RepID=A0A4Y8ZMU6_9SPHN|nr:hypothetical protein [Sphingomonas parva]TFI57328.1 hypothetical protein E2493_15805 [Sphingomonas parva]
MTRWISGLCLLALAGCSAQAPTIEIRNRSSAPLTVSYSEPGSAALHRVTVEGGEARTLPSHVRLAQIDRLEFGSGARAFVVRDWARQRDLAACPSACNLVWHDGNRLAIQTAS